MVKLKPRAKQVVWLLGLWGRCGPSKKYQEVEYGLYAHCLYKNIWFHLLCLCALRLQSLRRVEPATEIWTVWRSDSFESFEGDWRACCSRSPVFSDCYFHSLSPDGHGPFPRHFKTFWHQEVISIGCTLRVNIVKQGFRRGRRHCFCTSFGDGLLRSGDEAFAEDEGGETGTDRKRL